MLTMVLVCLGAALMTVWLAHVCRRAGRVPAGVTCRRGNRCELAT